MSTDQRITFLAANRLWASGARMQIFLSGVMEDWVKRQCSEDGQKKMERGSMSIPLAQSFVCCAPRVKPAGVASDVAVPAAACPSIDEGCANGCGSSSASLSESDACRHLACLLDALGDCSSFIDRGVAHTSEYSRFVCHTSTLGISAGCREFQHNVRYFN